MARRTTRLGLLIVLAALPALIGCFAEMPGIPNPPDLQPPLKDTEWRLVALGQPGSMHPALANKEVTLAFVGDSEASGSAGCNGYGGSYESGLGGTLTFSDLVHTEMYCVEPGVMDQEQFFLSTLQAAENYEVIEGRLHITGDGKVLEMDRA